MITPCEIHHAREAAAKAFFESDALHIHEPNEKGSRLAIHDRFNGAPLSPYKIHMRDDRVSPEQFDTIAYAMLLHAIDHRLMKQTTFVTPIPNAGTTIADSLIRQAESSTNDPDHEPFRLVSIPLLKTMVDGKRSFTLTQTAYALLGANPNPNTLLIDDLVATAFSKVLAAEAIRNAGGNVWNLLVFTDRSYDARGELREKSINLEAVWPINQLLEWGHARGYITRDQHERCVVYPEVLDRYLRATT